MMFALHVYACVSFSVEQQDKIRRCEDFRRSWHNARMVAHDAPIHHGVDYYVQLCRWHAQHGHTPEVWVHDLDTAYRQIPIRDVDKAYMILQTPSGPSLWWHNALWFGAAASVWNFNRFADLLQWIAWRLLWIPAHHYVDDFAAVEAATCSQSGFECFYRAFGVPGLQMKAKKALAPSTTQKLLGVIIQVTETHVILQPCPARSWIRGDRITPIWMFLKNNGPPKSSILIGFSIINHPFWGTPIFGNTHIAIWKPFGRGTRGRKLTIVIHHVLNKMILQVTPLKMNECPLGPFFKGQACLPTINSLRGELVGFAEE